jgi:hypothetical protein
VRILQVLYLNTILLIVHNFNLALLVFDRS